MFIFWLIFLLISVSSLLSYKKTAKEVASSWGKDAEKVEIILRQAILIFGTILSLVGLLGLFGIIKVR